MRISVQRGTVNHSGRSLCETCRQSTIIRGAKLDEQIVECDMLSYSNQRVPFPVTSCSRYADKNRASLREMEEIAWVLRSDPHRRQVGFIPSRRLKDEDRYVLEEN